ncbi:MAG TPA: MFS transporter [Acholeplasmataceae bacterium]|nr:MFS transporter [Acholeplasmataceae bacterium]
MSNMKKKAFLFIMLLGIISFFSDFTHEGARSIYGSYLGLIGASALVISFTAGLGEFIGQALRLVTGWIADKTKKYWTMMIVGYAINLLAIPLLGLVGESFWEVAIVLILLERVGKAIRAPAKSTLTSFTQPYLGAGKAFAINEALDQLGAFLGPLIVFFILSAKGGGTLENYRFSFLILGIFAIVTLCILFFARYKYPNPDQFEKKQVKRPGLTKMSTFVIYMIAIACIAMGFIDYPVLAFHLDSLQLIESTRIPLLYAMAMGVDAIAALLFGHMFDKKGLISLVYPILISGLTAPLILLVDGTWAIILGIICWGIGMGAQESILKAVVAKIVPKDYRARGYGVFATIFGLFWFLGSVIVGALYDTSLVGLTIFVVSMEILGAIILIYLIIHLKLNAQKENLE